jgi:hypothetical protein
MPVNFEVGMENVVNVGEEKKVNPTAFFYGEGVKVFGKVFPLEERKKLISLYFPLGFHNSNQSNRIKTTI